MPASSAEKTTISAVAAYLQRIGAELVNFRRAVVREEIEGYTSIKATVTFAPDGSIDAPEGYEPTVEEQEGILAEVARRPLPRSIPADNMSRLAAQRGSSERSFIVQVSR